MRGSIRSTSAVGIELPITKRPCSNCPFRSDGAAIELASGRLESIASDLLADDHSTFVCHKTIDKTRMTCAGAVGFLSKAGQLPVIARLAMVMGIIAPEDIAASAAMVIEPHFLGLS